MRDVGALTEASLEPPLHPFSTPRRLAAEALGTALLLAIVIGSGIMGERLAGGNVAIALLGNTLSTGAGLTVLITIFGPLSGAHFNPAVTLVFALRREIGWSTAAAYIAAQIVGGVLGVWAAHAMFAEPIWQVSTKLRDGPAQAFAEFVATFGLIAAILGSIRFRSEATPMIVGLYITVRLLVHRVDLVRQPGGDVRPVAVEHVRRHRAQLGAVVRPRAVGRCGCGERSLRLALEGARDVMTDDFPIVIYHNPDCGTSRNVLAMTRAAGYTPTVIEYLKVGWTLPHLHDLLTSMGQRPRDILREKGTPAAELGLLDPFRDRRSDSRRHGRPSDSGEPADRHHAEGRQAMPPLRGRARPARPTA